MLEWLPLRWLVDQHVPLIFFLLAFLTHPLTWKKAVIKMLQKRLGNIEGGKDGGT